MKASHRKTDVTLRTAGKTALPALIETTWDQNSPYSAHSPEVNGTIAPTGCVATAMAQVVNFWKEDPIADGMATVGAEPTITNIYDLRGRNVGQSLPALRSLPKGIYVIRGIKLVVK